MAEDAVLSAFHILNQFDIPEGSVVNSGLGQPVYESTEWTSVADLKNLRWYFRTYVDQSIRMVDLKEAVAAAKGKIATIPMEQTKQPITNVSASVSSMNHAAN
jgi:choloylglycine hydrolase